MARFDTIAVYMMASTYRGRIYLGVTSDLVTRVSKHRIGEGSRFTDKYWCRRLVWYEVHSDMRVAIQREKSLKRYLRAWKIELIENENPNWVDLWYGIIPGPMLGERQVTPQQLLRGKVQELSEQTRDDGSGERKILGSRPSALPENDSHG